MVQIRPAEPGDLEAMVEILEEAVADLIVRMSGHSKPPAEDAMSPATLDLPARVALRRPAFEHLAATAESSWIATNDDGRPIGYARAIVRDEVWQLTEFFVRPSFQGAGIGRELLARAFPAGRVRQRVVVANIDPAAIARYLLAGLTGLCPIYTFSRRPEPVSVPTDLVADPITTPTTADLEEIAAIDRLVLDVRRDVDHRWLASDRRLFLWRRGSHVVGYGYVGRQMGPFAVLDPEDLPAVLAHAETVAAADGRDEIDFDVPLPAGPAVRHLIRRGYRPFPVFEILLADRPFGQFDRYVFTSPSYIL
jgi:GNAT superfamily N-acetyltransferase